MKDGFLKVAAAAPEIRVADPAYNTGKIIDCIADAKGQGVKLLTFPELVLTGATCGHLYFQRHLTDAAMEGLKRITASTQGSDMLVIVETARLFRVNRFHRRVAAAPNEHERRKAADAKLQVFLTVDFYYFQSAAY